MNGLALSNDDICEFKQLSNKHFGTQINDSIAKKNLLILVRQIEMVYQPIEKSQFKKYVNKYEMNQYVKKHVSK
jgi:hypothetical protein